MTRFNDNGNFYRRIFLDTNGAGPWPCYGCGEPVMSDDLTVHHIDFDHFNHDPKNLTSMHAGCHLSLHHTGRKVSPEVRAKISASHRGMVNSPQARAKISAANKGIPKRVRLSQCVECSMVSTGGGIFNHQQASGHTGKIDTGRWTHDDE